MSAREIYEASIRTLPAVERLRLASLILDDLAAATRDGVDLSDEWSDDDVADLAAFSVKHADSSTSVRDNDA
jgi:hypothetical protein